MKTQERNLGVDLLRIICMLAMVIQHLLGHGWIMNLLNATSWKYELLKALQYFCLFGISCFALISGYVGVKGKYRYSALALQWAKVWLYSVAFTALAAVCMPGSVGTAEIRRAFLPTLGSQYWYFTAYAGSFMLVPFVRMAMLRMNRRQASVCTGMLIAVFSLSSCILGGDPFYTDAGKGTLWLVVLYAVGAYIKLHEPLKNVPTWGLAVLAGAAALLLAGFDPVLDRIYLFFTGSKAPFVHFPHNDSPNTLLLAVAMLLLFSRLRITHGRKWVSLLGGASFGVYLIHDHPLLRQMTISKYAYHLAGLSTGMIVPGVLLAAAGVYLVCAAIDIAREKLFVWLKLRQRFAALEKRLVGTLWED